MAWKVLRMLSCTFGPVKLIKQKSLKMSSSDSSNIMGVSPASGDVADMARFIIVAATCSRSAG